MRECLSFKSSTSSTSSSAVNNGHSFPFPPSQGTSTENTPASSSQPSSTINLSREFSLAKQTDSYKDILSRLTPPPAGGEENEESLQLLLAKVIQPDQECVKKALEQAKSTTFIRLASSYLEQSEKASLLCFQLYRRLCLARTMYGPIHDLLDAFQLEPGSLTQSLFDLAFNFFHQFDNKDNPFHSPESPSFNDLRNSFSQLKQQLDISLRKSRSKISFLRHTKTGSGLCLIVTAVGVVISAIAFTAHALLVSFASPLCVTCLTHPNVIEKKELARLAQLDTAAKGTYVLNNDLDTIDRLVARIYTAVEADKFLIRLGLERDNDRYRTMEVLKQLQKNQENFRNQLEDLEEHLCLCFLTVNRSRSQLLQVIDLCPSIS